MATFVVLLHVLGWGVLVFVVAPQQYELGSTGALGVLFAAEPAQRGLRLSLDREIGKPSGASAVAGTYAPQNCRLVISLVQFTIARWTRKWSDALFN